MIPYGRQNIDATDIEAVVKVMQSDFLTQGPFVPRFEEAIAKYVNANFALATNSATSALHMACLALGVGLGDIVWTSPITFVASSNCALYCGATVDFVDIDPDTFNMCPVALRVKLEKASVEKKIPKVVIPVHLGGEPCDMQAIQLLAEEFNFKIIEDASHAIGAIYEQSKVGSCKYSDITVFSFHPVKIITSGEGGMALCKDESLFAKMYRLRSHGITRSIEEMTSPPDGPWYYQQLDLGFNYRMTDMEAALGLNQLKRLDDFVEERHRQAELYNRLLEALPLSIQKQASNAYSSFHLYIIRISIDGLQSGHKVTFERLRSSGIGVGLHYIPVYRQPYYEKMGFKRTDFPEAEKYYSEAMSLPIFPGLKDSEIQQVVKTLSKPSGFQTLF